MLIMAEYIKRETLINAIPTVNEDKQISLYGAVADFMVIASSIPAADVVEVKHGEWLGERGEYECSVCGNEAPDDNYWPSPYCPCCGAKMDKKAGAKNECKPY